MHVEYNHNNSGGRWWLTDQNWKDLEAAGWRVEWFDKEDWGQTDENGVRRWLGAMARSAVKEHCGSIRVAAAEWEHITELSATDPGCPCCGQPHMFTLYDDEGKFVDSGPHTSYEASW